MSRRAWETCGFMMGASAILYSARLAISVAGPEIKNAYQLSESTLGLIFSAFSAGYVVAMAPAGRISDRWGPATVLGAGGLLAAACVAATGAAGLFPAALAVPLLIGLRFCTGVASAPVFPACGRLTANWFSATSTGLVQGLIIGAAGAGGSAGTIACSALLVRYGWQGSFYAVAAVVLVFFAAWSRRVRNSPHARLATGPRDRPAPWGEILRDPRTLLLGGSYAGLCYFYNLFDSWLYYYFREVRHTGEGFAAWYAGGAQLALVIGMPLGGWATDRLAERSSNGRNFGAAAALAAATVVFYAGVRAGDGSLAGVLLCVAYGLAGSTEGAVWASVIEARPGQAAGAYGVVNTLGMLGYLVSPTLLPVLAARLGWTAALLSGGLALLANAAGWLALTRWRPGRPGVPTGEIAQPQEVPAE